MLHRSPSPRSDDSGEDIVLFRRGASVTSHGPIAPPCSRSLLTPASREFVPSRSLLSEMVQTERLFPKPKIPVFPESPRRQAIPCLLPTLSNDDAVSSLTPSFSALIIQVKTTAAYNSSLATPQLTHSGYTSSPGTSEPGAESPTSFPPPPNPITRGVTSVDLNRRLNFPDSINPGEKPAPGVDSPSDSDFDMPIMRGGESVFPLPFPAGPNPWTAAPMTYPNPGGARFPQSAPIPGVAPGYANLIAQADMAAYHHAAAAPPIYPVAYPTYAPAPAPVYAPPAPTRPPVAIGSNAWVSEAMHHFSAMNRDGPLDTTEAVQAAERFLATYHQNNTQYVTYNANNGAAWNPQPLISPQHGALMARAALPQMLMYPSGDVRTGVCMPMPQPQREMEVTGIAPNNRKKDLYKTEPCRNWEERGECRYQEKCQFAHGVHELRLTPRHPKYKTEFCKTWYTDGSCPYAGRCCFIHPADTTAASAAGRMLPGPGGEPFFPHIPSNTSRGQSLLERIRNNTTDTQTDVSATSHNITSPLNTRQGTSPGMVSNASAFQNVSPLPRVSSTGNMTSLIERDILSRRGLSNASPGSGSVDSVRDEDATGAFMTVPTTPTASDSSVSNDRIVPSHFIMPSTASTTSSRASHFQPPLNLRLNTSMSSNTLPSGPQTAPVARATMSTASLFGPVSPTLQRNAAGLLVASTPSARAPAVVPSNGAPFRGSPYSTMNSMCTPPSARLQMAHSRGGCRTSESSTSTPAPVNGLALNIPNPAVIETFCTPPMTASANVWVQPFSVGGPNGDKRW